jgi:hypothetical protein
VSHIWESWLTIGSHSRCCVSVAKVWISIFFFPALRVKAPWRHNSCLCLPSHTAHCTLRCTWWWWINEYMAFWCFVFWTLFEAFWKYMWMEGSCQVCTVPTCATALRGCCPRVRVSCLQVGTPTLPWPCRMATAPFLCPVHLRTFWKKPTLGMGLWCPCPSG